MLRKRQFTLVELMIVVAIVAVLAAIAVPQLYTAQLKAKRAELPTNVQGLMAAQVAYEAAHDTFWDGCGNYAPRDVGTIDKSKVAWSGVDADCITNSLSWEPDGFVYGAYETFVSTSWSGWSCNCTAPQTDGLTFVDGIMDADDNGSRASYLECWPPETVVTQQGLCTSTSVY